MEIKMYRSRVINQKTKWNYPLRYIEVLTDEDYFEVIIYDVGYEPPYYDATSRPMLTFQPLGIQKPYTIENIATELNKSGIYIDSWDQVPHLFLHESNSIMRPDIRADISETFGFDKEAPKPIPGTVGADAIRSLVDLDGHTVLLKIQFLEKGFSKDTYRSYLGYGYIKFRDPATYNHWGFVSKGNRDNIAVLVTAEKELRVLLYDQLSRSNMMEGYITELNLQFMTSSINYKITSTGMVKLD